MDRMEAEFCRVGRALAPKVQCALQRLRGSGFLSAAWPRPHGLPHLLWLPGGQPQRTATALVSSRLGRRLHLRDDVFRMFRSACGQLNPAHQILITSAKTTLHRFVARAAQLYGIPLLDIRLPAPRQPFAEWATEVVRQGAAPPVPDRFVGYLSPPFVAPVAPTGTLRDRFLVHASEQLWVLHARPDGQLRQLVMERLRATVPAQTYLAVGSDQLVGRRVADPLVRQGAVAWPLAKDLESATRSEPAAAQVEPSAPIVCWNSHPEDYLLHCTRAASGPWPDQTEADYLDELILGSPQRDRSSLATLKRIVVQRRLTSSSKSIRGGTPVVSFTAVAPGEISALRRFQAHRGRWDFEPYGIGIARSWLVSRGAQPVHYGDETTWHALPPARRPFFQKERTKNQRIDWRYEREWRHLGDVDLDQVPKTQAIVFVPTLEDAHAVARISPWPVALLPSPKGAGQ